MEKILLYKSASVAYEVRGHGEAVVLLHGFGEAGSIWGDQVDFLQGHCFLMVPNLPGSGRSDMLLGDTTITIEDYADCIHALLLHEEVKKCTLIGHSMGGYIALAFAKKYPAQLEGIGLVHSTAFADSEEKKKNRLKGIEFIDQYGSFAFLKASTPNLFSQRFRENFPEKIEALINASGGFSKAALQQYYRAMIQRPDSTAVLKGNPVPVLFVVGTEDIAAPIDDVLQQVHLPNKSYIHVLNGIGHMSMLEEPEALNRFLLGFINR